MCLRVPVLLYAIGSGWDNRGRHFHPLFQFQLMGILGAFLTGDAFNLFVFFEVLLIASYGLMIHAAGSGVYGRARNMCSITFWARRYSCSRLARSMPETGTLNMADLAMRVATLDAADGAGIRVAAVLLLLVFAVKAAILPLHFWLPASYAEAPAPVAALFAIMTKVGAYCIIRFYTLVFPPDLEITQGLFDVWLMPAALLTVALGMAGVLGAKRADRMVAFSVIGSMGMLLAAVSVFTPAGISAALYYAIHSTFAAAALFMLIDVIRSRRGAAEVSFVDAPPMTGGALVAGMFFVAAIAMTGLPPLSGFVGKLLILDAARSADLMWWVWATILVGSLIAVVGFSRAGSQIFWNAHQRAETPVEDDAAAPVVPEGQGVLPMVSVGGLLALLVALTVAAGPVTRVLEATSAQLFNPERYLSVVLTTPGKEISDDHGEDTHGEADGSGYATDDQGADAAAAPEKDH